VIQPDEHLQPSVAASCATAVAQQFTGADAQCLFSANILKINHWGKCEQRYLRVTRSSIYKLVANTFKVMKQTIALQEV
jgi:hypothetical protein